MSPDFLAVVAPHGVESSPPGSAFVPGVAMALAAVSLGLAWYCGSIQRELMNISRALRAAPARWHLSRDLNARPALRADAPTAVLWVNGFDALGIQSILAIGQVFREAFSQIVFASVHSFDVTDAERAEEAGRLRSSLENSIAQYAQMTEIFGMTVGTRVVLGPDVKALGDQVADELARCYPRSIFFIPRIVITPPRWYHRLLASLASPSFVRRLKLRGIVAHEIVVPVRVASVASRARFSVA